MVDPLRRLSGLVLRGPQLRSLAPRRQLLAETGDQLAWTAIPQSSSDCTTAWAYSLWMIGSPPLRVYAVRRIEDRTLLEARIGLDMSLACKGRTVLPPSDVIVRSSGVPCRTGEACGPRHIIAPLHSVSRAPEPYILNLSCTTRHSTPATLSPSCSPLTHTIAITLLLTPRIDVSPFQFPSVYCIILSTYIARLVYPST